MLKVFIADDHDTCRMALKLTILLVKQFEIVGEASSGKNLAEEIISKAPDIAVIDLSLPGKNGFEVFKELQKKGSKTKVIIWTAHSDLSTVQEAVSAGVHGYLCKGATVETMKAALAAVLDRKQWVDPSLTAEAPAKQGLKPLAAMA